MYTYLDWMVGERLPALDYGGAAPITIIITGQSTVIQESGNR